MHSHQKSSNINKQMLISSPKCSLNCNGLSLHLPPLGGRRETHSGSSHRSPPMSGTLLQQTYDRPSPKLQNGYVEPSVSPPSPPSTLGKRSPKSPVITRLTKPNAQDLRLELNTSNPTSNKPKPAAEVSETPTKEARRSHGDSTDELSANSVESTEAHQLIPGIPGVARRAKAHVPSACVNCKKKHLACETKRPCNRCMQTGKEATCVDVQHKKRGRPRLREEETLRGLAFGPEYPARDLGEPQTNGLATSHSGRHRSKTYRELRSQPDTSLFNQRPRTSDSHFSQPQYLAGMGYSLVPQPASFTNQYTPTAVLTTDFVVAHHNRAFIDALSLPFSVRGQTLLELVVPSEKERIRRLQASLRAELRDSTFSPTYSNGGHVSIPTIESLNIAQATAGFQSRSEYWTFRLPCEQSRGFPISISLGKNGPPFVVLTLVQSAGAFSPSVHNGFQSSPVLSSPTSITALSPTVAHSSHRHHNSTSNPAMPYLITSTTTTLDDQLLAGPPSHSLVQYKNSPPRSVQQIPHNVPGSDPATSGNALSMSQGLPAQSNQPLSRDSLRHLQLPPILTAPTGHTLAPNHKLGDSRRRVQSSTPEPGRGSPGSAHGGKRKKRRRVEIGDMLH